MPHHHQLSVVSCQLSVVSDPPADRDSQPFSLHKTDPTAKMENYLQTSNNNYKLNEKTEN
jgi:hypothetical protein